MKTNRTSRVKSKRIELLLVLALLLVFVTSAQAVLFRVGPNDVPSPPGNGFPLWYQDTAGLAVDLCLPKNVAQLDSAVCLITNPVADPVAGLNLPLVFPTNFPDEAFYWNATAVMDVTATSRATLVLALEAAFATAVVPGDQITFGRIRIVVDAPVNGTYTVRHPYGEKIFPNVTAGRRAITFTDDIGIGAAGDFSGALQSGVGPFLRAAVAPGGAALPLFTVPGDPSGDQFLSDAATPVFVTGSPQNTNFFEICVTPGTLDGTNACKTLDQFNLMGKVHTAAIGSPLTVNRATYARSTTGAHVDVSANASPGPGALTPKLFFGDAAGTRLMPSKLLNGPTNLGQFYGQSIPTDAAVLPASVIVTNTADNPPSSTTQSLVDAVTITQALYNPANGKLTITATSSDKGIGLIAPPQLSALGLPDSATGSDALVPAPVASDPARQQLVYTLPAVGALRVPPSSVTVTSTAGGQDTEVVNTFLTGGVFAAGGPIAVDNNVSVAATDPRVSMPLNVLLNDAGPFNRATVRIVTQPQQGTLTVNATTGLITYTFIKPLQAGDDSFTYTVTNPAGIESNVATVIVTITP